MAIEKWPQQIWQMPTGVGGSGGKEFQIIGPGGTFVKKLRFYKNKKASRKSLRGIDVTFTDDSNEKAGAQNEDGIDFFFEPGEKVKSMTLWGNGIGTRTGRIQFETSKGRTFDYGQDTKGQTSYATDVGSGLLIGFTGRSDAEIDCLAAVFLKPVETTYVDKIKYPNLDISDTNALTLRTLSTGEGQWNGSPYVFRFTGSETDQTTTTFNNKVSTEIGAEVTFKTSVPMISGTGAEYKMSLKLGYEHDWGHTTSKSAGLTWNTEHKIEKPEDAVKCTAACYEAKLDIKYTGVFHVVTKDDQEFAFPTKGTLEQVTYSKVQVSVEKLNGSGAKRSLEDSSQENGHAEQRSLEDEVDHEVTEADEDTPEDEADDAENEEAGQQEDLGDNDVEAVEPADGTTDGIVNDDEQDQDVDEAAEDNEEGLLEEEDGNVEAEEDRAAEEDEEALPEEESGVLEAEEEAAAGDEEALLEEAGDVEAEEEAAADEEEAILQEAGDAEAEEEAAEEDGEALLEEGAGDVEAEEEAAEDDEEGLVDEEAGDVEVEEEEAAEDNEEALLEEEAGDIEAEEDPDTQG